MPEAVTEEKPRRIADSYVEELAELDPITAVELGLNLESDLLPDLSPAGLQATADLGRRTLARLDAAEAAYPDLDAAEMRCARLLRERLSSALAIHEAGEDLRAMRSLMSPLHRTRDIFVQMPTASDAQWAVLARRLARFPQALDGYRATLTLGMRRGLLAAPRQVSTVLGQLATWLDSGNGTSWFADRVAAGPEPLRAELDAAAASATTALAELRGWIEDVYAPAAADTPDAVGRDRYRLWSKLWNGADFDFDEAYDWAWGEFHKLDAEMRAEAGKVLPGATPLQAAEQLKTAGPAIEGAEQMRAYLQELMDRTIGDLQGTHFDLAEPVTHVEAMIAPAGSAPAPYYTMPSLDFSRPGRTWLPLVGDQTHFPLWFLTSGWYHEGVPGHHLQLAQWVHVADSLSKYQVSVGDVSANTEGWALYAERLMDELGYHTTAATRLGYLASQMLRLQRVIVDIGMHLRLDFPDGSPYRPGEPLTPEAAREFLGQYSGLDDDFLDGEVVRYLGLPGQAIGYKLGERTWLRGREAARTVHGEGFDLKAWHMAALSQGSQGLDELYETLARL